MKGLLVISLLILSACHKNPSSSSIETFTVQWLNWNGDVLEVDNDVVKNTLPEYNGETPEKEKDEVYDYSFLSWDKELAPVVEDITYTATFEQIKRGAYVIPSKPSGFYDEAFNLDFDVPYGFDVYYTLDNSEPDENSLLYKDSIEIKDVSDKENKYSNIEGISSLDVYYPNYLVDKCNIVKAVAINKVSKERSDTICLNYFIDFQNKEGYTNLPVVSIDALDDDLFDYEKGIYVTGKIYDESEHTGYPETYPANYHQKGREWEREAFFKYFEADKTLSLEQNIGIRIHGGWSRAFNQKSFNLYARKEYSGTSTFNKEFFGDIKAHSLMIRSGGYRDTTLTKIRDSLDQDFSEDEKFDIQRSMPVIVFLNGEYWGIYNLQERYSDNYVKEHHNIKKSDVLIIKNDEIDEGNESDYHFYEELIEFFKNTSFTSDENYELAKGYIDVEEFSAYMATQLYIGNIDWPGNNVRMYKDVSNETSKWHFMMYDTDDSSGILSYKCGANIDPFLKSSHWKSGPLESDCILGLMLSKLIENDSFKEYFRNDFMRIGQKFSSVNVKKYLDQKSALLSGPMVMDYKRFANNTHDEDYFLNQVSIIQKFFDERYEYAIGFLNEHI